MLLCVGCSHDALRISATEIPCPLTPGRPQSCGALGTVLIESAGESECSRVFGLIRGLSIYFSLNSASERGVAESAGRLIIGLRSCLDSAVL